MAEGRTERPPGRHDDLTDVAGVRVGHYHRIGDGWRTGTTVVLLPPGSVGAVDVRGGGPCTRETDALAPGTLVEVVHAICLSGGSVFGLAAASGVADWLASRGAGLPLGTAPGEVVPIVPAACLFDLRPGAWDRRPDAAFGRAAAEAAAEPPGAGPVTLGSVGAGAGARSGPFAGGVGSASVVVPSGARSGQGAGRTAPVAGGAPRSGVAAGVTVAALAVVNSAGSPAELRTGRLYGADLLLPGEAPGPRHPLPTGAARPLPPSYEWPGRGSTVLVVVATDLRLGRADCMRVAMASHDGLARAFRPAHGLTDGDVVFALSTGAVRAAGRGGARDGAGLLRAGAVGAGQLGRVMAAGADVVTRACVRAVLAAAGGGDPPSHQDCFPGVC